MATAQGIIRYAGSPIEKVYYTAYYKSNNGGSAGPGAGQRASQWMSGVYLTEASGLYSVALSSDNFLGAAATVSNGDQLIIIAWRKSAVAPAEAGGHFYSGQSRTTGQGGTHDIGFKYDSGDAPTANYGEVDQMVTKVFTLTGQTWNATPGGVGGDVNGDLVLGLNVGPTANFSNVSKLIGNPTLINRNVSFNIDNTSGDYVADRAYAFDGQIILQQSSAAHNPTGGVQIADGSAVDGSRYTFSAGLSYGMPFGTPVGGNQNTATESIYAGPGFPDHAHIWPHIDTYQFVLTVKDDNETGLTAFETGYVKTQYRAATIGVQARQYVSWSQFVAQPNGANPNWNSANPNTINDVVRLQASVSNPDASIGRINSAARGGIYSRLQASKTLDGSPAFVINEANIHDGLPGSAPFGFITLVTNGGADVRHSYEIVAVGTDSITIDTAGSTLTYTNKDWYFLSSEPCGGTDLSYNWEVRVSGGAWSPIGKPAAALVSGLSTGSAVNLAGIGEGVIPGWWFRLINGPARGYYQIASVTNDNAIVLAGAGLLVAPQAGDTWEITARDRDAFWAQGENDALDFRITASYTRGWPTANGYVYAETLGPITQTGVVNNLPPQSVVVTLPTPGASTTYTFDGQKSYGTQTVWVQEGTLASGLTLDGTASFAFADSNLDSTGLRDGHAWILFFDANGYISHVFPIVDIDLETPDVTALTIDTKGLLDTIPAGTAFKTTNSYEIEGPNTDNDVTTYSWRLRSAASSQTQPTSAAEFESRFDQVDGSGTGPTWAYTYSQGDDGRFACIELTVTDAEGATHTIWEMFPISVSAAALGGRVGRRIEWD